MPSKYYTRWARRIRETTGLTREDADLIALATFGTIPAGTLLGVDAFVTYDQPMINAFNYHQPTLTKRLKSMTRQLQAPYRFFRTEPRIHPQIF